MSPLRLKKQDKEDPRASEEEDGVNYSSEKKVQEIFFSFVDGAK